jgi:hypothetical protein
MRIQRVLMPGSGAESWTVLGEDCPYVSRDHVTGYRSRQAWSAVGWVRGCWPAQSPRPVLRPSAGQPVRHDP